MLHLALSVALAAVLVAAAAAKLRRPRESADALRELVGRSTSGAGRSAREHSPFALLGAVAGAELALAAGVAAGLDLAAFAAAAFLLAGALLLARALRAGRGGAPCGCFGARSRITRGAAARAVVLAAAFAALPLVPDADPSAEAWLAVGLGVALLAIAGLGVAVLALAREVGMLRLAVGPQGALEVDGEGPELGSDSGLAQHLDPRIGDGLALVVFTSEGCGMCRRLAPGIRAFARHPHVSLLELDEVADADHWRRLNVPGSPYALALAGTGRVLAKGTFNSLAQLESVLAAAERRRAEAAGV